MYVVKNGIPTPYPYAAASSVERFAMNDAGAASSAMPACFTYLIIFGAAFAFAILVSIVVHMLRKLHVPTARFGFQFR
jgi:hypothetical protein